VPGCPASLPDRNFVPGANEGNVGEEAGTEGAIRAGGGNV